MQPTLVSTPFHREGWVYEEKYDGWRMVAYKREDRVQLISRQGRDHTSRFPELVAAVSNSRCASRSERHPVSWTKAGVLSAQIDDTLPVLELTESHLTWRCFGQILSAIEQLACHPI